MSKATLVIMAAGIGSRFGGGIKQLEPVGPNGEIIMDYSIYDAMEAGFDKVVFVIRRDLEKDFKEVIGNRIEKVTMSIMFSRRWMIFQSHIKSGLPEEQSHGEPVRQFSAVRMWWTRRFS